MIYEQIRNERKNQDAKWGVQTHSNFKWTTILTEEVGEAARESLEQNFDKLKKELVQVAAVCVAWLEDLGERHG